MSALETIYRAVLPFATAGIGFASLVLLDLPTFAFYGIGVASLVAGTVCVWKVSSAWV